MGNPRRPVRFQLRRVKGWRKPAGAIVVARPTRWGNPIVIPRDQRGDREYVAAVVAAFRANVLADATVRPFGRAWADYPTVDEIKAQLRGHDLVCFCRLDMPCHADVLLELANSD
jgi:hypothetical protein